MAHALLAVIRLCRCVLLKPGGGFEREATLGRELVDEFIKYKTAEWDLSVSQWEIERYSHLF